MNLEMTKRALAARDAHLALLDLKKLVDEAARTTHAAELEAVHLVFSRSQSGDISTALKVVKERMGSGDLEAALTKVRENLEAAIS